MTENFNSAKNHTMPDEFVTPAPKPVPVEIDEIEEIKSADTSLENVDIVTELVETPIVIEETPKPKPKRTRKKATKAAEPTVENAAEPIIEPKEEPIELPEAPTAPAPKKKRNSFILD